MTENPIVIKPYEPIDDAGLLELIGTNVFQTTTIDFKFLVSSSFDKFGWKWVALVIVLPISAITGLLLGFGYSAFFSLVISVALTATAIYFIYGLILPPIRLKAMILDYKTNVLPRLTNIKKSYLERKGAHFWIATQKKEETSKEKIVGCVLVRPYDWKHDHFKINHKKEVYGKLADFGRMSVSSEVRRQGLGQRLLNQVLEFARAEGYDHIAMSMFSSNKAAEALYLKTGFKRLGSVYYEETWFPSKCNTYIMKLKN